MIGTVITKLVITVPIKWEKKDLGGDFLWKISMKKCWSEK